MSNKVLINSKKNNRNGSKKFRNDYKKHEAIRKARKASDR